MKTQKYLYSSSRKGPSSGGVEEEKARSIFISHSERDRAVVELLRDLLVVGLGIHTNEIFVSSLEGQGFDGEDDTREKMRISLREAQFVIFLITPNFQRSEACMNEHGAAWIMQHRRIALVCEPVQLGKASYLIDIQHQLSLQNNAKLASLKDLLKGVEGLKITDNAQLWHERLDAFAKKLPDAIANCRFDTAMTLQEKELSKQLADALEKIRVLEELDSKLSIPKLAAEPSILSESTVPETLGEYIHMFPKTISNVDTILIASHFIQTKNASDNTFTVPAAHAELLNLGIKLSNSNVFTQNNVKGKKVIKLSKDKYRLSPQGLQRLQSLKE